MSNRVGYSAIELPEITTASEIPRQLHHICLPDATRMPSEIKDNIAALRALHPDWDYKCYGDAEAEAFIKTHYGTEMLIAYQRIDPIYPAARADLLRYLLCYAKGGVYLDLKATMSRSLNDILRNEDKFLINQWTEYRDIIRNAGPHRELWHIPGGEFTIWCIAAVPGHPFLKATIERVLANMTRYNPLAHGVGRRGVLRLTGPIAFSLAIAPILDHHPHRKVILDPDEGMRWTIYDDWAKHQGNLGTHYSDLLRSILNDTSPIWAALASTFYGRVIPFAAWVPGAVKRRLLFKPRAGMKR